MLRVRSTSISGRPLNRSVKSRQWKKASPRRVIEVHEEAGVKVSTGPA